MSQYHKDNTKEILELVTSPNWKRAEELIKFVDWPNTYKADCTLTKARIIRTYGQSLKVYELLREMKNLLWAHLFDAVTGLGDDSYGDLCWHIVSLGRDEILRVTYNPAFAQARADKRDYKECFAYVLPHEDDYEKIYIHYHQNKAAMALGWLIHLGYHTYDADVEVYEDIRMRMVHLMDGDVKKATEGFDHKMYNRFYEWKGNQHHALYSNTLGDAMVWLTGESWKK